MGDMTVETFPHRGGKVTIEYDQDGSCSNPRDDCNLSRFVFSPHNHYVMPNEIDFPFGNDGMDDDPEDGGRRDDETPWQWFVRTLKEKYGALYVVAVGMIDHSGTSYYVGGGEHPMDPGGWDSGTCGVAIITQQGVDDCGTPPEMFAEVVASEVEAYSMWANGEVYGWVAWSPDGDVIDSCWGFVGLDNEQEEYMAGEGKVSIDAWVDARDELANALAADAIAELVHG